MQNAPQSSSSVSLNKKLGEESEKSSTPQSSPTGSGADPLDEPRPKFMSDSSESEEEDVSEVESFMLDQDVDYRQDSKFLLSSDSVDPETQERLEALLQAAGIGPYGPGEGKQLADPEVLRRLTSSVSCALDEAAAALTRMRTDHPRPTTDTRSLVEACSDGDVSTVRKLLTEGGKSVHETNEEGESLLSLACSAGYLELAQVLIAMSANVEDRGVKGDCTPLMEAASSGHVDIVALLLNHNAQVNAQSTSGNTPLMFACAGGHEDVVKVLLECAANVEDNNENGHTPLMEAASAGHVGVAQILLNYGAGINTHSNEFKESALTLACYKGHLDMVRFLLEAGADQEHKTDEMHTALMEASMDGHVEVARLLLDSGAQVNMPTDSFESPLTLAACGGHTELAMLLIERGANIEEVNDEGYTPLMEASREGHEDMVALLLTQGANINAQTEETQETALTLACCGGFLEVADFLLKAGADLEAGASTPLMEAAQEGHIDIVRYLLEYHHAQVNAQTQTGDTALTYACENGHTDVASLLLVYGADLEHESEGGRTPLMKACRAGHTYTVQYLISKNADVNKTTTNNDHTPLSLAATGGHLPVVEVLLANRADPFHRLKDNSTMLIEAAKGGHTNVVHLLLDYPHSVVMQATADGEVRKVQLTAPAGVSPHTPVPVVVPAPGTVTEPEETAPLPAAPPPASSPLVQVQRSLLRKLRPTVIDTETDIPSTQQLRSHLGGDHPATAEDQVEDESYSSFSAIDIAVKYGLTQPYQVSQNTAISDRPKAKPFSKKDGKTLRKMLSQSQPVHPAPCDGTPAPPLPHGVPPEQQQSPQSSQSLLESIPLDKVHIEVRKFNNISESFLQHEKEPYVGTIEEHKLMLAAIAEMEYGKGKNGSQPMLDFAHKLEGLTLDDVAPAADQERLQARQQQLTTEDPSMVDEGTYKMLSQQQQQQQQDLTYITVPTIATAQNQPNDQGLHVQYQYAHPLVAGVDVSGLQLVNSPLTLSAPGPNGQSITVTRTAEGKFEYGSIQITGSEGQLSCGNGQLQMLDSSGAKLDCTAAAAYAAGFHFGATAYASKATGVMPGLNLPSRLMGAAGYSPQLLLPSPPLSNPSSLPTFCCPNEPPALEPAPARTQVQVATQTITEKKGQTMYKGKKVRFSQPGHRHPGTYAPTVQPDPNGLAQCSNAPHNGQCGAPTPPLQLSACMDVDSETDSNHDTALTLACAGGHEELVELLLSRGADIEHRDKKGFTPLILAATAGHEKVVEILLNHGGDIEAQSERTKDTPLSLACSGGRYEVVELLLNKMASKEHRNVSDYTPLSLAASGGYVNIIKLLLNHGAEINSRTGSKLGISPLMLASMNGHVAAVKLLLDMGSDINAQIETNRNTALTLACFQGRHEVVSLLLDRKANVEHRAKTGLTPLMEAASGGYVDVGRVLIDKGADVNASPVPSSRDTALTIAADKGHVRFVELLLSRNAMVEVKNKKGNSPLWLAANGGHLAVVELLYNLDADIDSQDNRKVSCLMAAFRRGHVKVVKWMVNHVTQFPSDQEMTRFIATISDKELLDKCHECVKVIRAAKDLQSAKANKNASILLEELDMEKTREESKKAAAARKRERKKKKKLEKKEERRKLYEEIHKAESDDEEEEEHEVDGPETDPTDEVQVNEARKAERLGSTSPMADKEEGDSGIDANSQGSCSSNDAKTKETVSKRKEKKKKKGADKVNEVSSTSKISQMDNKDRSNKERRLPEQTDLAGDSQMLMMSKIRDSAVYEVAFRVQQLQQQQEREQQRHPAEREDFEATGNETYVPASKGRKSNSNHQNHHEPETGVKTTSPKGTGKREEGWKEVVRNFPYRSKKVSVPLNAISRVIGRGGSNINAIRSATGAHIEVEKQGKGQGERIITIKGSADATKQAHNLIAVLIKDPDVDIVQMLPKSKPGTVGTWEKPSVVAVSKTKAGGSKPNTSVNAIPVATGLIKLPAIASVAPKLNQPKMSMAQTGQPLPIKTTTPRLTPAVDAKRSIANATKTTMSYTSAIMTSGRGTKPTPANHIPVCIVPGSKPRPLVGPPMGTTLTTPAPPATAPVSPQVSPPQAMPASPKHHRPQPTSSAPPSMQQGQMPGKPIPHPSAHQQHPNQHLDVTHNLLQEYSLFNDSLSKNNMWGREQEAGKLNFASVAATGAPPGSKFLDDLPNQVDITKAPGYRGNVVCSPVSKPQQYCSPNYPEVRHDPATSPRGESLVHAQINIMPPVQMDASGPVPIGTNMYGGRGVYPEPVPSMYSNEMAYRMQGPSPPPAAALSRLNPRAPDFAYGSKHNMPRPTPGRWAHVTPHDLVYSTNQPDMMPYDNGIAPSPMSPSSPIQPGMVPGEVKLEDRKIPRPIGTERNWKHAGPVNGYEQLDWAEEKQWHASFRPSVAAAYRNMHEEIAQVDHYQPATDPLAYNGIAEQLMYYQQQGNVQMAAIDPSKMDPAGWDVDKHSAYSEVWTSTKWTQ